MKAAESLLFPQLVLHFPTKVCNESQKRDIGRKCGSHELKLSCDTNLCAKPFCEYVCLFCVCLLWKQNAILPYRPLWINILIHTVTAVQEKKRKEKKKRKERKRRMCGVWENRSVLKSAKQKYFLRTMSECSKIPGYVNVWGNINPLNAWMFLKSLLHISVFSEPDLYLTRMAL